jgi:hypothetical protein
VSSAKGTPFAAFTGMARTIPLVDVPPSGSSQRQRNVRWPVVRPIIGHAFPMQLPIVLRDISADGFSGVANINLRPGVAYYLRFAIRPHTIVLSARLTDATRISGDQDPGYLLRFEFVDTKWDRAAIAALIAEATLAAF